jgi:hypothetical protein
MSKALGKILKLDPHASADNLQHFSDLLNAASARDDEVWWLNLFREPFSGFFQAFFRLFTDFFRHRTYSR